MQSFFFFNIHLMCESNSLIIQNIDKILEII